MVSHIQAFFNSLLCVGLQLACVWRLFSIVFFSVQIGLQFSSVFFSVVQFSILAFRNMRLVTIMCVEIICNLFCFDSVGEFIVGFSMQYSKQLLVQSKVSTNWSQIYYEIERNC